MERDRKHGHQKDDDLALGLVLGSTLGRIETKLNLLLKRVGLVLDAVEGGLSLSEEARAAAIVKGGRERLEDAIESNTPTEGT
jgi:hypothetical protein